MATNGTKTPEDAEMGDCDGKNVVTMMDVLKEQQDFEDDANAVLGASDDKNCTYSKGYVKRQAIYACLTCCPDATTDPTKRAGVCLACSLACHENHDLVELYTKRNFRCDCGNPKFTQPCQFTPNKTDLNYDNKYNHNFSGIYCNCKRPYPDPEATEEEEMIQCIICEDWLHTNHLEATVPNNDQYAEMICKECMDDIDFLHDYSDLVVNVEDKEIVIMDPDLDVTSELNAKDEKNKNEQLSENSKDKEKAASDSTEGVKSTADTKDDVEMTEPQPNTTTNAEITETKTDTAANADVNESKTDISTDAEKNETKPDESGDGNVSKEEIGINSEQSEKTDTSADAEPDSATAESKVEQESNKDEKKEEIKPNDTENATEAAKVENNDNAAKVESSDNAGDNITETPADKTESSEPVDKVEKPEADSATDTIENQPLTTTNVVNGDKPEKEVETTTDKENESPKKEQKRKLSQGDNEISPKKQKIETEPCIRPKGVKRVYKGATFWPSNFRQKLCTCTECLSMYKDLAVLFLTDLEDTVTAYEALGKINDAPSSQYEKGLQALSSLDRVQQINALTEYNKMRDKLLDYLKSFKDRKEIVKEEDIKAFFAGMKPKREPDGVYFCR